MSVAQKNIRELEEACDRTRDEFAGHLRAMEAQGVWLDRGYQLAQTVRPWLKWLMPLGGALLFKKRKEAASGLGRLTNVLKTGLKFAPTVWSWWRNRDA
jgi:hypothetical protein